MVLLWISLLLGSARASICVRMEDTAALLTEAGGAFVEAGAFEDIVPLGSERFAAAADGQNYALMDGSGTLLTGALYSDFRAAGEVLLACRDGQWGLMDLRGEELGAFAYSRIAADGSGRFWALRAEAEPDALWLADVSGAVRDSGLRVLRIGEASEGLLPVMLESRLWGCCDSDGRMVIPAEYAYIGAFVSGRAAAVSDGRYGAIDRSGAWIAEPAYDFLEISAAGFLLAVDESGARTLDMDGGLLASYPGEDIYAALVGDDYIIGDGETLRVYDASGALLHELAPDASVSEGVGGQLVISEGMWGEACVRLSGTQTAYQNLYPLGMAGDVPIYACMKATAARYENDLLGEIQISVDMDSARYGLVNGAGEQIQPCIYISIDSLANDRFLVRTKRQWRVIDTRGKIYWYTDITRTEAPNF